MQEYYEQKKEEKKGIGVGGGGGGVSTPLISGSQILIMFFTACFQSLSLYLLSLPSNY